MYITVYLYLIVKCEYKRYMFIFFILDNQLDLQT